MAIKHIIFDLDGTLINSFPTIIEAYQLALEKQYGKREQDQEKFIKLIGLTLNNFFDEYPLEDREQLKKSFALFNDELQYKGVPFFSGVEAVLKELIDKGAKLHIVTSKRKKPVLHWLKQQGKNYFTYVVASEDTEKHKPNGQPIDYCISLGNIRKEEAIYVGDTHHDIQCAHNAGIRCAIVDWTMTGRNVLEQYKPDLYIKNPNDLLNLYEN